MAFCTPSLESALGRGGSLLAFRDAWQKRKFLVKGGRSELMRNVASTNQ